MAALREDGKPLRAIAEAVTAKRPQLGHEGVAGFLKAMVVSGRPKGRVWTANFALECMAAPSSSDVGADGPKQWPLQAPGLEPNAHVE
jgi:hypothetical protein